MLPPREPPVPNLAASPIWATRLIVRSWTPGACHPPMLPATHNATTPASFQRALPFLLAPISPSLAALHATRVRRLSPADPTLAGTHCARCGYPLLASGSQTRSVRKKRKRSTNGGQSAPTRIIRRSCRVCGHDEDVPVDAVADAPTFPKPRDRARRKQDRIDKPRASSAALPAPDELSSPIPGPAHPRASQPIATSSSTPAPSRPGSAPSSARATPAPQARPAKSSSAVSSTEPSSSTQQDQSRAQSRTKKKAGLQSMLARNRERQEQDKKREGHSQGASLSAFLQGL